MGAAISRAIRSFIGGVMKFIGTIVAVGGVGTTGYQFLLWLREGHWTQFDARLAWYGLGGREPRLPQWQGIEKIAVWVLDLPLSIMLLALGFGLASWGFHVVEQVQSEENELAAAKKTEWRKQEETEVISEENRDRETAADRERRRKFGA